MEAEAAPRWPGCPGASVFRLVVGGDKVGGLIGRRGEIIRRLCEETRARVRVLEAMDGVASRIVRLLPGQFWLIRARVYGSAVARTWKIGNGMSL
jgi:transcription antitermination factor NusA-like protein